MIGKPYSGKPNVRFDEGELEIEHAATTPALYSTEVLKASEEGMERRYGLKAEGLDLERVIERVSEIFGMREDEIKAGGKTPKGVAARSVVSYWAVRELGLTGMEVARRLGVTQPAVSQALKRGARIIEERHLKLKEG
jgi:putative transposase